MKRHLTKLLLFIAVCISQPLQAVITIEITEGVEGAIPMSVVEFDSSSLPMKVTTDIADIITNNLNRSGVFKVLNKQKYPTQPVAVG